MKMCRLRNIPTLEIVHCVLRIRDGLTTSEKEDALKIIQEVGHDGIYITHPDTMKHFGERWFPSISDWDTYDNWEKAGPENIAIKANKKYIKILDEVPESLNAPESK